MDIKYVVSVKQVVNSAPTGQEPKITETVLADFTGGPNAAAAVLASLAESVQKGKKVVGFAAFLQGLNEQMEKQKAEGKPTFFDELGDLLSGTKKPGNTNR